MAEPAAAPGSPTRASVRIGDWMVDAGRNQLRRGAESVRIEPKAMDVLMLLAGRVGDVVSREALFAAVWPDVVVGDEALTQSINKLRRALGDNPRAPQYIETISKRGYRLIAPVGDAGAEPPIGPASSPPSTVAGGVVHRRIRVAAVLAGLAIAIGVVVIHYAYSLRVAGNGAVAAGRSDGSDPLHPEWVTVTVVPFESFAPAEREQAYLARGLSDSLITDLSGLSGLRLIRASSDPATQLDARVARYRITGSVRRDASTLRIEAQLADSRTGEQVWAGRFDRPAGDLFAVQDEITAQLVALLPGKVSDLERQRISHRYTHSLDAYDYFLRARSAFLIRQNADNQEARALYRKALEVDPKFARAYAGLAMTYAMDYRLHPSADMLPALDRAVELADTARSIDPDIPEVYWALGFVQAQGRRHEQAIDSLQHAIALDPSFADAYALLAGIDTYVGQPAGSIPLMRTAMRLNPDGGYLYFLVLGRAYLFDADTEQALINLRAALKRNPVDLETHVYLAAALVAAADPAGARWEADEIRALMPGFSVRDWLAGYPMTDAKQRERLAALVSRIPL